MNLTIADTIFEAHPNLIIGVLLAHDVDNAQDMPEITAGLRAAEAALPALFGDTPVNQHPNIETWREAYRNFGAKPKEYPSSVENLTKRVLKGTNLPHINNLVSLYNTISLRYILPVGGEDLDQVAGDVLLTKAGSDERAILLLGEKEARPPHAGEIMYKDDAGAICRRWNWKEADRTKLTRETRNAFLVIEALPPVTRETVETAIRELAALVKQYCGGTVSTAFLDTDHRTLRLM